MVQFEGLWYEFIAGLQKKSFELQTSLIHHVLGVVSNSSGTGYVGTDHRSGRYESRVKRVAKIQCPHYFPNQSEAFWPFEIFLRWLYVTGRWTRYRPCNNLVPFVRTCFPDFKNDFPPFLHIRPAQKTPPCTLESEKIQERLGWPVKGLSIINGPHVSDLNLFRKVNE